MAMLARNQFIGGTDVHFLRPMFLADVFGNIPRKYGHKNGTFTYLQFRIPNFPLIGGFHGFSIDMFDDRMVKPIIWQEAKAPEYREFGKPLNPMVNFREHFIFRGVPHANPREILGWGDYVVW